MRALGGAGNIAALSVCATRVRVVPADWARVDREAIERDPRVVATAVAGGQLQIVVGPGRAQLLYEEFTQHPPESGRRSDARSTNLLVRAVRVMVDIFTPLIPVFVAGGLLAAMHNILAGRGAFAEQSIVEMVPWLTGFAALAGLLGAGVFALLPVLLGFSAAGRFGGSSYLGASIGAALVAAPFIVNAEGFPALHLDPTGTWQLWGIDVLGIDYLGTVVPIIVICFLLAMIEKGLRRGLRGTAAFLFAPMLALLCAGAAAFLVIGPVMRFVGDALANGLEWLYDSAGVFGGAVFGGLYSPLVVSGLHQGLVPVELGMMANGGSFIFPIAATANVAQAAACLAIAVAAQRGSRLRAVAAGSSAPAALGIAEPAIFGVNLRLRFPFIIAVGATTIAGGLIAAFGVTAVTLGAAGVLGFASIAPRGIVPFLLCLVVSSGASFAGTFAWARWRISRGQSLDDALLPTTPAHAPGERHDNENPMNRAPEVIIAAPVSGTAVSLESLSDPVFAASGLGPSVALAPAADSIHSPVDGRVTVVAETGHAYGVVTDDGAEVLVHIGIDTVTLGGAPFSPKVRVGDTVVRGDLLAFVDQRAVVAAGCDPVTIVAVTNPELFTLKWTTTDRQITEGATVMRLEPRRQS